MTNFVGYLFVIFLFSSRCSSEAQLSQCDAGGGVIIEQVTRPVIHGEGPHWHTPSQTLYFVDISNQTVNQYNPKNKKLTSIYIERGPVSPVIPSRHPNAFFIGRGRDLVTFTWDGQNWQGRSGLTILATVDHDRRGNRFNDGKADASGRIWIGTMGPEDPVLKLNQGSFYSFSYRNGFEPKRFLNGVSVSNGLGWTKNDTIMFYIDSPTRKIDAFDFDLQRGTIKNRKTVFNFDDHNLQGVPDGMAVDRDDNIWIAVYDGGVVLHVDPRTGSIIRTIRLPAGKVTSCAFGGPGLSTLYVTTSRRGLSEDDLSSQPNAGSVFAVHGLGVKGQRKSNSVQEAYRKNFD